jgi:hypothetical protein
VGNAKDGGVFLAPGTKDRVMDGEELSMTVVASIGIMAALILLGMLVFNGILYQINVHAETHQCLAKAHSTLDSRRCFR